MDAIKSMASSVEELLRKPTAAAGPEEEDDGDWVDDFEDRKAADEAYTIKCNVFATKEHKARNASSYIAFLIRVTLASPHELDLATSWVVARRYRNFEHLHEKLCTLFDRNRLPSLPKKGMFRSLDPEYIAEKRQALDQYMQGLLQIPQIAHSDALCSFLVGSFRDIMNAISQLRGNQKQLHLKEIEQAQRAAAEAEKQRLNAVAQLDSVRQNGEEMRATIDHLRSALKASEDRMSQMDKDHGSSRAVLGGKDEEIAKLRAAMSTIQSRNELLQAEVSSMPEEIRRLNLDNGELKAQVEALTEQVKLLKSQKKVLIQEVKRQKGIEDTHSPASVAAKSPTSDMN